MASTLINTWRTTFVAEYINNTITELENHIEQCTFVDDEELEDQIDEAEEVLIGKLENLLEPCELTDEEKIIDEFEEHFADETYHLEVDEDGCP